MSKTKDTVSGGAQGAAVGTAVLPGWGTAIGAGLGGLGGYMGWMPGTGDDANGTNQVKEMEAIRKRYDAYRPEMMASRTEALQRALGVYQPMAESLGNKWGIPVNIPNAQGLAPGQFGAPPQGPEAPSQEQVQGDWAKSMGLKRYSGWAK